jgi:hypothetical protein
MFRCGVKTRISLSLLKELIHQTTCRSCKHFTPDGVKRRESVLESRQTQAARNQRSIALTQAVLTP